MCGCPRRSLQRRHIQLNGPASFRWMPHDIDHASAYFAHRDANMPEPNFIAINPENGHGHSAVLLTMPVARHAAARSSLYIFMARSSAALLGASVPIAITPVSSPKIRCTLTGVSNGGARNPTLCRNWPIGCSRRTCSRISAWKPCSAPAATAPSSTSCASLHHGLGGSRDGCDNAEDLRDCLELLRCGEFDGEDAEDASDDVDALRECCCVPLMRPKISFSSDMGGIMSCAWRS